MLSKELVANELVVVIIVAGATVGILLIGDFVKPLLVFPSEVDGLPLFIDCWFLLLDDIVVEALVNSPFMFALFNSRSCASLD